MARRLLSVPGVVLRRDTDEEAELLVLRHENAVLRRQPARPVRYEPVDRFWSAALSSVIPHRRWHEVFAVTPGTLLARHRRFIAAKWDYSARRARTGRPPAKAALKKLILQLARENAQWGHRRIQGEPWPDSDTPSPHPRYGRSSTRRASARPHAAGPTWREFLTNQAQGIVAVDFLHIDTVLGRRLYALAFPEHGTRRLHIAGITAHPTREWAVQQAPNLTADLCTRMEPLRFLLRDRDGKYGQSFDAVCEAEETEILKSAPRAPRTNAHCERVIGSIRREALDHVLIMNEAHARHVLAAYERHYNEHRPHRARTNYLRAPTSSPSPCTTSKSADSSTPASSAAPATSTAIRLDLQRQLSEPHTLVFLPCDSCMTWGNAPLCQHGKCARTMVQSTPRRCRCCQPWMSSREEIGAETGLQSIPGPFGPLRPEMQHRTTPE
jgi:hypothetical protein